MRRMRTTSGVAVIMAGLLAAACGVGAGAPSPRVTFTTPAPPTLAADASPLSGRPGGVGQPILAVKIENTAASQPHAGLNAADVVYVEQVEYGITRFAALFSTRLPEVIGPIRSARIGDIDILDPYGRVAFAYSGAQSRLRPVLYAADLVDVSGDRGATGYYRATDRRAPHNFMGNGPELMARAQAIGAIATATTSGWVLDPVPMTDGEPIRALTAAWPTQTMTFTWDPVLKAWYVGVQGERLDAAEGGVVVAATVVVQYVDYVASNFGDRYGGVTPEPVLEGQGSALIARDGRVVEATWERSGDTHTRFRDAQGRDIPFAPGTQWILLVPAGEPVALESLTPPAPETATETGSTPSPRAP